MGGVTSIFRNNSELVDHLVISRVIKTENVERVFRAVDRGSFFLPEDRTSAYKDLAWNTGKIHRKHVYLDLAWNSGNIYLSYPSVYAQVLEHLDLYPGLSFINLGSGTGYFSTMAGLLLGRNGINHGIEINEHLIEYANEKVNEFERTTSAFDEFEFSRPQFMYGNCLNLDDKFGKYDRIYCGAGVFKQWENYMKNLLKVNGILIMVMDGKLISYTRVLEDTWVIMNILSIHFPPFYNLGTESVELITNQPKSLKSLCRMSIRSTLRSVIEKNYAAELEEAHNAIDLSSSFKILDKIDDFDDLCWDKSVFSSSDAKSSNSSDEQNSNCYSGDEDSFNGSTNDDSTTLVGQLRKANEATSNSNPVKRRLFGSQEKVTLMINDSDEDSLDCTPLVGQSLRKANEFAPTSNCNLASLVGQSLRAENEVASTSNSDLAPIRRRRFGRQEYPLMIINDSSSGDDFTPRFGLKTSSKQNSTKPGRFWQESSGSSDDSTPPVASTSSFNCKPVGSKQDLDEIVTTDDDDEDDFKDEELSPLLMPQVGPIFSPDHLCVQIERTDETEDVDVLEINKPEPEPCNLEVEISAEPSNSELENPAEPVENGQPGRTLASMRPLRQRDNTYRTPYTHFMREGIRALPMPELLKRFLNLNRD